MDKPAAAPMELDLDLGAFESVTEADLTLKNPLTGAPTGAVIRIAGPEHPKRKRIVFDRQRRLRAAMQKAGRLTLDSPEDDELADTDMLVACTLGWTNLRNGAAEVPFTPANVLRIYTEPKLHWLRDQVKAGLEEREAFIARSEIAL